MCSFDNIDHELVLELVGRYTQEKWLLLYVERWLKADIQRKSGEHEARETGTPQGSGISPLLSNIYLHHAFDTWMEEHSQATPFERFADDVIVHCTTYAEAVHLKHRITEQLAKWKLTVNEEKTRIVYCKDSRRRGNHDHTEFTFLGYTFRQRRAKNRTTGRIFSSFQPAISQEAMKEHRKDVRAWRLDRRTGQSLKEISRAINDKVRGWFNYHARFYPSAMHPLYDYLNKRLINWATRKYKRLGSSPYRARQLLDQIQEREPKLFAHWSWRAKRMLSEGAV